LLGLVVPTYRSADGERWLLLTRGVVDMDTGPGPARTDYGLRWHRLVELKIVDSLAYETVRRVLKKTCSSRT
jgi:hypothetical protein